jgi:DNA-directed RNA polymerase subunit N (RpoN/RPB10)
VSEIELPTHCFSCRAHLEGGATRHREGCAILKLIREAFPSYMTPGVVRTPHEQRCIECGHVIDALGTIDGDDEQPSPNESLAVCISCGAVHMIGDGFEVRALTPEERSRLANDTEQMRELRAAQRRVHFARAALN